MSKFAKLTDTINISEDFADLANADPLAAVVYMMTWTKCWPWAVLPGKPLEFKAVVCPGIDCNRDRMRAVLDLLAERGHITIYADADGSPLIHVSKWNKHNVVKWQMVSLPKCPMPEGWQPPAELLAYIRRNPNDTLATWWRSQTGTPGYNGLQREPGRYNGIQTGLDVDVDVDVQQTPLALAPQVGAGTLDGPFTDDDSTPAVTPTATDLRLLTPPEPTADETADETALRKAARDAVLAVWGLTVADIPPSRGKGSRNGEAREFYSTTGKAVKDFGAETVIEWAGKQGGGTRHLQTGQSVGAVGREVLIELATFAKTSASHRGYVLAKEQQERDRIANLKEPLVKCGTKLKLLSKLTKTGSDEERWPLNCRGQIMRCFEAGAWDQEAGLPKGGVCELDRY